jgi:hypothetical protein
MHLFGGLLKAWLNRVFVVNWPIKRCPLQKHKNKLNFKGSPQLIKESYNIISTPKFIMGVLAQAQNDDKQFWNIEISCQPIGRLSMHSKCLVFFFLLSFGWEVGKGGGGFLSFSHLFPTCSLLSSQWVLIRFPMGSPRVFPIAPPLCFAQSPPLLTYIGGPKGKALRLSIESSILGSLHSFNFFLQWGNQIGSLQKKKKDWTWEPPPTN